MIRVTYLEQTEPAAPAPLHWGSERITVESLTVEPYLDLYRRVGSAVLWDERLRLAEPELAALLAAGTQRIYVLRDAADRALGFCEFDRSAFPQIELQHFGVVREARGRGLGSWLLATALQGEWRANPDRIWLHTDTCDHPAARHVYAQAGFRVFAERDVPDGS